MSSLNITRLKQAVFEKNKFNRDVLWNIGSLGILGAGGLCINFIIIACRGPEALGVFNQVFAFYIIISQVAVGGLQFSALKHCSHAQDNPDECARIAASALMLVAGAACPICIVLFACRHLIGSMLESPPVAFGLTLAIPGMFLFSLNKVLLMVLNGLRHMRAFAVFQSLRFVLILSGVGILIFCSYPAGFLPLSLSAAELLLFVLLLLYINIRLFILRISAAPETAAWFRRHLSFGFRGFLSGVLIEMNTRIDVLMLGYFMSDAMVGIYSFASTFAEGFAQLTTVIRQNVDPIVGKCFADGNREKIRDIARKVRTTFFPIMLILGGALTALFPLLLIITGTPAGSWGVFAILTGGIVIASGYNPFIALIMQGGRPGTFTLLIAGTVMSNIVLNYCLIPVLGIYGAASATAFVYVLEACMVILLAKRLFGIRLY